MTKYITNIHIGDSGNSSLPILAIGTGLISALFVGLYVIVPMIGVAIAALITAITVLTYTAVAAIAITTSVHVYKTIRDRPVYEAIQRDVESQRMLYARSQRLDGEKWEESTAPQRTTQRR